MKIRGASLSAIGVAAVLAALAAGALHAAEPTPTPAPAPPASTEAVQPGSKSLPNDDVFARLFAEGVGYMRQGRSHEAIIVFEAARKRQPEVPEVLVNLGYLHLNRKNYAAAQAAFGDAITLRPDQVNAYYGLGMAWEGLGDIEGALGAMRTYLHLEPEGSPFHRKATAAVWELEERLKSKRDGKPMEIPPGAISLPDKQKVTSPEQIRRDYVPPAAEKP